MDRAIAEAHQFDLQACSFFITWQGVLSLVYTGFPVQVVALKDAIAKGCPELKAESPGSMWPKTSLGALRDGMALTRSQFDGLHALCAEHSAGLTELQAHFNTLTLVEYQCRSLEQIGSKQNHPLVGHSEHTMTEEELLYVQQVLKEADSAEYWEKRVVPPGNREGHYRDACSGRTLVGFLDSPQLKDRIRAFEAAVDSLLSGMYAWFDESSLHVTVRGL